MEKQSYTAVQRRAVNQIWAAAGEYGFEPLFLAQQTDGTPDFYMNCMVGLAHRYFGEQVPRALFDSWAGDARQPLLDDLAWLVLESLLYRLELPHRPVLEQLRAEHAEEFFAKEHKLSRQEWMAKNQLSYTMQTARWRRVLGRRAPVMTPYERRLSEALEPRTIPAPDELRKEILDLFRTFALFDGKIRARQPLRLHFDGLMARILLKTRPSTLVKIDRVTVEHSSRGEGEGGGLRQDTRRAAIHLRQNAAEDRSYIQSCFGRSLYSPERLAMAERELCTGLHQGCHLWFTAGVPSPEQAQTGEARQLAEQAARQADLNRQYFAKNRELHNSAITRLTEQIRNCILVHQQPNALTARSGTLNPARVWRATVVRDDRVFLRPDEENQPAFTVDLLLDSSASRLHCQEVIAAQGVILAESLRRCGIPVRVCSFCSLRGYTVLRVLKSFADQHLDGTFHFFASGWNRDGLALRAAGDLLQFDPGPASRHLLILLTDAAPNDSRRVLPGPEHPLGCNYEGAVGVRDTAAEVRRLQHKGIRVAAVFMGASLTMPDAETIYGRDLARIRGMDQLAGAAGRLIQNEIRELGD